VAGGEGQTAQELAATLGVRRWQPGGNGSVVVSLEDMDTRQEILDYCQSRSAALAKAREAQATPPDPATALAVLPDPDISGEGAAADDPAPEPQPDATSQPEAQEGQADDQEGQGGEEKTPPGVKPLSAEEEAFVDLHVKGFRKDTNSASEHILALRDDPREVYRTFGTWEDACWHWFGHGAEWARMVVEQARLQREMQAVTPDGSFLPRLTQFDAKHAKCLEGHPDLLVAAVLDAEAERQQKGRKRKPVAAFQAAVDKYAKYLGLRYSHKNVTADEMRALHKMGAMSDGRVDARVLLLAKEVGVDVEGLLLDGGGTANVLAAGYRGQKLATLAEALGAVWEEYHKREKQAPGKKAEEAGKAPERSARANENGHDKKEVVISGGDRSGTRSTTQPKPGEDEDGDQDEDDALLPKVRITLTAWVKHEVLEHLKGGACELWLTVYAPPEGAGPNADNKLVGMLEADTWEAEEMAEEGSWPQATDGQPAAQLEGPKEGQPEVGTRRSRAGREYPRLARPEEPTPTSLLKKAILG
jgi:hypothetical protein